MSEIAIQREVVIDAPADVVWRTITEPSEITKWFADRVELDASRVHSTGVLIFDNKEKARVTIAPVVIETFEPTTRFAFRWGHGEGETPTTQNSVLVVFTLVAQSEERTLLRVVESGLEQTIWPDDDKRAYVADHGEGWTECFARLAALFARSAP